MNNASTFLNTPYLDVNNIQIDPVNTIKSESSTDFEDTSLQPKFKDILEKDCNLTNVNCIEVKLLPDYVEITSVEGVKKQISHLSFKKIINSSILSVNNEDSTTGILPPSNTIYVSQIDNTIHITCYYSSNTRDLLYNDSKLKVITPNIIISHVLSKDNRDWVIKSSKYFCTDLPISKLPKSFIHSISHKDRIWLLPLSNTYEDGKMCYGNNSMPSRFKDNNFRGLDYYFSYLWITPFNDDLGIKAVSGHSPSVWYKELVRNKEFPYDKLKGWVAQ